MKLYNGDAFEILRELNTQVDMILTDPPYKISGGGGGMLNDRDYIDSIERINPNMIGGIDIDKFLNMSLSLFKSKSHFNGVFFAVIYKLMSI